MYILCGSAKAAAASRIGNVGLLAREQGEAGRSSQRHKSGKIRVSLGVSDLFLQYIKHIHTRLYVLPTITFDERKISS